MHDLPNRRLLKTILDRMSVLPSVFPACLLVHPVRQGVFQLVKYHIVLGKKLVE